MEIRIAGKLIKTKEITFSVLGESEILNGFGRSRLSSPAGYLFLVTLISTWHSVNQGRTILKIVEGDCEARSTRAGNHSVRPYGLGLSSNLPRPDYRSRSTKWLTLNGYGYSRLAWAWRCAPLVRSGLWLWQQLPNARRDRSPIRTLRKLGRRGFGFQLENAFIAYG